MAGLYKYFSPVTPQTLLPDLQGPLSKEIPSAITKANFEVGKTMKEKKQADNYVAIISPEMKAKLGKYSNKNGVAVTFHKIF